VAGCHLPALGLLLTDWLPVRALVTGSAGFVGRHFVRYLRDRAWTVLEVDIKQGRDARDFFRGPPDITCYDLVLHCAAYVGGRQAIDHTPLAQAINLELDAAMFRWAARAQPGRVVYFSSSAAYPVALQDGSLGRGLRESDIDLERPALPDKLYGWNKITGEKLAELARAEGVAVSVVRPFSGYGSDQDPDYPFPAFIDRALAREDPFTIWGTGHQARDFIHIDDIVSAVMTMCAAEESGPLNLCSGYAVSFTELAVQICGQAGYRPRLETIGTAPQGVTHRVGDPASLSRLYLPRVPLQLGIEWALRARSTRAH
jgi:nucleoside-diphosphate-sugar epimerase